MDIAKTNIDQEKELIEFLKFSGNYSKLTDIEIKHFISMCKSFKLNPLKREIHLSVYGLGENRQLSIVTGYETYIKRAERTGQLDGWEVITEGEGDNLKAIITIWRKDRSKPFRHEVYAHEYIQTKKDGTPNSFWRSKKITMIKKVAISQGFRLFFCDELDGLPYTREEIDVEEKQINPEPIQETKIESKTMFSPEYIIDKLKSVIDQKDFHSAYQKIQKALYEDRITKETYNTVKIFIDNARGSDNGN